MTDFNNIMNFVKEIKINQTKKTILSALYILTGLDVYKELMITTCNVVNETYKQQKRNPKQNANHVTQVEVKAKYDQLLKRLKGEQTAQNFVDFIIIAFMSGIRMPPRRNEYCDVMVKGYNKTTDNYVEKSNIVFNSYKTAPKYGKQTVIIPRDLVIIINKSKKLNPTDYLLYNVKTNKKLSSSDLTKRLHVIFDGKKVGCDELRSSYISNLYKDVPKLLEFEQIATAMSHSTQTAQLAYVKK
jgi:hypothetical protein